jgi:hypothetical protein
MMEVGFAQNVSYVAEHCVLTRTLTVKLAIQCNTTGGKMVLTR